VLILWLKRYPRAPGILIAVVGATLVVAMLDLEVRAGLSVLGALPGACRRRPSPGSVLATSCPSSLAASR
jgi:MFS superfamily sulfate permease-like transporter